MEKIRKAFSSLWLNKERLFLGLMIAMLCYQVWKVINPSATDSEVKRTKFSYPGEQPPMDDSIVNVDDYLRPPASSPPERASSLNSKNPFWVRSSRNDDSGRGGDSDRPNVRLRDVQELANGEARARIDTKWYSEGDKFRSYELLEIDVDTETCTIFSYEHDKSFELEVE